MKNEIELSQEPNTDDSLNPTDSDISIIIQEPEHATRHISILVSIKEIERFIQFIAKREGIKLPDNLIVLIQKTDALVKGYYCPNSWGLAFKHQEQQEPIKKNIHEISISSINLIFEPYETIAHEFAHYLNTYLDNYEGNFRNYHTKDFKKRAEQMLLKVESGNYGFNVTSETDEFKRMIQEEFKPNPNAFKIFQPSDSRIVGIDRNGRAIDIDGNPVKIEPKTKSRMILYSCSCGVKIRTARNEIKPLKAICQYCNTEFIEVTK